MDCGSWLQVKYCTKENYSCICGVLQEGTMKDHECMFCDCLNSGLSLSSLVIAIFLYKLVPLLIIKKNIIL
jgi:hypothetical protein